MFKSRGSGRTAGRIALTIGAVVVLVLMTVSIALAGLVGGSLPTTGFTFTSVTDNTVDITGSGSHLKTRDSVNVKSAYSRVAPSSALLGWHFHDAPVFVTVTVTRAQLIQHECNLATFRLARSRPMPGLTWA